MNLLDIVVLVIMAGGTYYGLRRGLILEVFSLVAMVAGILVGIAYHGEAAALLGRWIPSSGAARFIGFALVFLVTAFVLTVLGRLVRAFVHTVFLAWVDHLVGAAVGFLKGVFVAWAILTFAVAYLPRAEEAAKHSRFAPSLLSLTDKAADLLPEHLRDRLNERIRTLRGFWHDLRDS